MSIDDWKMERSGNGIVVTAPKYEHSFSTGPRAPHAFAVACYWLCDAILREREACSPARDAPAPVPYEAIASDTEALVREHMRLVDDFIALAVRADAGWGSHATRRAAQARLAVEDSVRRIRGLR